MPTNPKPCSRPGLYIDTKPKYVAPSVEEGQLLKVALHYYLFPADGRVYRGRRARAYFDSFSSVASASTWFSVLRMAVCLAQHAVHPRRLARRARRLLPEGC